MRLFLLSLLSLVTTVGLADLGAPDLSPEEAEELGILVTVNTVDNSTESTIGFSLDTSQFETCQIASVYLALINTVGALDFGAEIAPRNRIYNFQLTPKYLDQTTVGIGCSSGSTSYIDKSYILYIGKYVQIPY